MTPSPVSSISTSKGFVWQWCNHLSGLPPAHLPRWLLLRILAYRVQVAALGGLDKETLLILRQPKGHTLESPDGHPFEARIRTTREGATLIAGRCSPENGTAIWNE